jgi:chromosome segregation ATPase
MSDYQVAAFNAEASEMAAELELQVQLLQEQAVELRRQINTDLSVENENLQGHLAELLVESAKWRTEANLLRADMELSAQRAAESERQIMLLNAQLVEARRQIDSLRALLTVQRDRLDLADREVERLRLEAAN